MRLKIVSPDQNQLSQASAIHAQVFSSLKHTQKAAKKMLQDSNAEVRVAIADGGDRVLGYLQARASSSDWYLAWIGVRKSARNNRVGGALLRDLKTRIKRRGGKSITLDSRNRFREALHFYLKNGFDIVGTHQGPDGDLMIRLRMWI